MWIIGSLLGLQKLLIELGKRSLPALAASNHLGRKGKGKSWEAVVVSAHCELRAGGAARRPHIKGQARQELEPQIGRLSAESPDLPHRAAALLALVKSTSPPENTS